jgi:dipeptidyl aminopeptidase/acylaminoacyl peptidase
MKRLAVPLAILAASSVFAQKHPFGPKDWADLPTANPGAVSTDGIQMLYTYSKGADSGPGIHETRLANIDGSNAHKLDLPAGFHPTGFTADGKLFASQEIKGVNNVVIYALDGLKAASQPAVAIPIPGGITSVTLSPDGKRFAVLASPVPPDPLAGVHTVIEADHASVYVVGVDGKDGKWWSPELKDVTALAWSTDSKSLGILSVTPKIGYHYIRSWIDTCDGGATHRVATVENAVNGLAWLGASEIAYTSTTTSVLTPDHLWTVETNGSAPVDRTPDLKGSVMGLIGDPHGAVWALVDHGVQTEFDRMDYDKLIPAFQWPGGVVTSIIFAASASGPDQLVFGVADPTHTNNLAIPDGSSLKKVTFEGDDALRNVDLGEMRDIHWTSKEGINLEGIATFPAGYVAGKKYPFVVYPHGGPEGNDLLQLDDFSRIIAGCGYVVIQPEYRGSTGYGSDFLNAIYQHFGDRAFRDVDSATDYAVAQGWADPNRLAIFGWSAGGFMTSWTVTQTDRYKAAVEGAGITDWGSFMWTSDVQQFDYDARMPHKDPGAFSKFSAVMYADRVTTPLLILHGAADVRVPTYQGREYFETLLALGKTTRMVTYPGSGHFPSRWDQIMDVAHETCAWLEKYDP